MAPGTALKPWLICLLPPWFIKNPEFTEAAYAFVVSGFHAAALFWPVLYGNAISNGVGVDDLWGVIVYSCHHWLGPVMGMITGSVVVGSRTKTAYTKATEAVEAVGKTPALA